jgi:hypothetical protein
MTVELNGSIAQVNPTKKKLTQLIDSAAQNYFSELKQKGESQQKPLDVESIRRFACYMAVSGRSTDISLSEKPCMFLVC